jgi:hypothetical protein
MSMDAITAPRQGNIQMIDSTSVRAHQPAATAKEGGIEIKLRVEQAAAHPISPVSNDKILEALDVNVCVVFYTDAQWQGCWARWSQLCPRGRAARSITTSSERASS